MVHHGMQMSEFRSVDPTSGKTVAEFPAATDGDLSAAVERVSAAFASWSVTPLTERIAAARRLAAGLTEGRGRYARLMAEEIGKPVTQGLAEIDKCASATTHAADHAKEWLAAEPVKTEARAARVEHTPLGPVLAIMPWNFPFWQLIRFGASALLAGNTILLKHAPNAPRCAEAIDALCAATLPRDLLVNVFAPVHAIGSLVADPRIGAVTLTGSTRAGRAVAELCGRALKPSVLELGGSDPFVVLADADLDLAARTGATARLQNNGQSCIAAKRFIVHRAVEKEFVERFRNALAAAKVGDPREPATTVGPLARRDLRDGLATQVEKSIAAGARCLLGGATPEGPGFFYPPTLIVEPSDTMPVWSEETFGPVAVVRVVGSDDEAVEIANRSRYALGAALFSTDVARAEKLASRLRGGAVFVNAMVRSDPRLPFGGNDESGWGRELGRDGMRSFTRTRSVWIQ
jgi:succinate-semialdehyde dehydrogenase/glutarate-semialdehyde dehydrogenase